MTTIASHGYIEQEDVRDRESRFMEDSQDQEAVKAVLAGDANAYAFLVERYQTPVFNLMYRMTGSCEDARDLAQEAFIKAYEKLSLFQSGRRFFPWLYAIGLNHARNFLRRRRSSKGLTQEVWGYPSEADCPGDEEDSMCLRLDSQKLKQALQEIPLDYREALILYYHEELPMEAVAMALSLSLSGAKMRVHRGLKKLRAILLEEHDEEGRSISEAR